MRTSARLSASNRLYVVVDTSQQNGLIVDDHAGIDQTSDGLCCASVVHSRGMVEVSHDVDRTVVAK